MSPSSPPKETELKFLVLQDARAALLAHPAFADAEPQRRYHATTYFDAPGHPLGRSGISLRIRHSSGATVQTLKRTNPAAALGQRDEWECALEGETPDLSLFETLDLDPALETQLTGNLAPVFTINVDRTAWQLNLAGTTHVEAVIDEGEVKAGGRIEAIREIELELKSGPIAPMFRLALDLASRTTFSLGAEGKADRGYRLLTGKSRAAAAWHDRPLDRHSGIDAGFREILTGGLTHLVANMPAAAAGDDEGVHQLHVALRRLRSCLVLFQPCIDPLTGDRFNDVLRELGTILGRARDWDIFTSKTLPRAIQVGISDNALTASADDHRIRAHQAVGAMLTGPALTALVVGMAGWSEDEPCLRVADKNALLMDLAPDLLDRLAHKVAKRGQHLETLDGHALHGLRKAAKKLRYSVDALDGLYRHKDVAVYRTRLKKLLDTLGSINDAAVTPRLVESSAGDLARETNIPIVTALIGWNQEQRRNAVHQLSDDWAKYRKTEPFWR